MKCVLGPVLLCLLITSGAQSPSTPGIKKAGGLDQQLRPPPEVEIELQADCPLRASASTKWVIVASQGIELDITVKNISDKAIRAYTTRHAVGVNESANGCFLMNVFKPGKVLQPGQSELRTTWRNYPSESKEPIHFLVDFVEFTDDSTWGNDSCESAQRLAGDRAGARAVLELLQKLLDDGGPSAVVKALDKVARDLDPSLEQSRVWREGFSAGVQAIIDRVRGVVSESGLPEIGPMLKQPYDASGYKIDVIKRESP